VAVIEGGGVGLGCGWYFLVRLTLWFDMAMVWYDYTLGERMGGEICFSSFFFYSFFNLFFLGASGR